MALNHRVGRGGRSEEEKAMVSSGLAEAEIADQMQAARQEWQGTVAAVQGPGAAAPPGVSRHDFNKWKDQQAEAARNRLGELEERLQRLQLLRSKLSQMKANAEDTVARSNQYQAKHTAAHAHGEGSPAQRPLPGQPSAVQSQFSTVKAAGNSQWSTIEDIDGDLDEDVPAGAHTRMPAYLPPHQHGMAPPFTPGMSGLRKIIRDEMTCAVNDMTLRNDRYNEGGAGSPPGSRGPSSRPGSRSSRPRTGASGESGKGRLRTAATRQAWTANTELPPEHDNSDDSEEGLDQKSKTKTVLMIPKKLEDAEPRSCPLIFGGLSRQSPLRIKCFMIMRSTIWSVLFYMNTVVSCLFSLFVVEFWQPSDSGSRMLWVDMTEYVLNAIFAFETLVGILALGLINGPTTFLRVSGMHVLDLVILLAIIVEYILAVFDISGITIVPFRIIRVLRIFSYFKSFSYIRSIVATLSRSAGQLMIVFFVILFFQAAISTLFLTLFGNDYSRRCVKINRQLPQCTADFSTGWSAPKSCDFKRWNVSLPADADANAPDTDFPIMIDDSYPFERWCLIKKNTTAGQYEDDDDYDLDFKGRYHTCGRGRKNYIKGSEMCAIVGNPSFALSHYDNIGGSLINLAQGSAPDAYYDIMWRSFQSQPDYMELLFLTYFLLTMMVTWLLLGIFVAVVTGTFKSVREDQIKEEELEEQAKQEAELDRYARFGFGNYHFWQTAEERRVHDAKLSELLRERDTQARKSPTGSFFEKIEGRGKRKSESQSGRRRSKERSISFQGESTLVRQKGQRDLYEEPIATVVDSVYIDDLFTIWCKKLLANRLLNNFFSLCILGHVFAMSCDQFDSPQIWREYAFWSYVVFNALFSFEMLLRAFAAGTVSSFFAKKINIFEFGMVVIGLVGMSTNLRFLKLVPAVRLYRLMSYLPTLENLMLLAIGSFKPMFNLFCFIVVMTLGVAVTGRYVFGVRMNEITRSNFGSFFVAEITVFQLMIGDSWSGVVYAAMHSMEGDQGSMLFAGSFILGWFIFSSLIVNNLFVAVIIENFEVAETIENIAKPGSLSALRMSFRAAWRNFSTVVTAQVNGDIRIDVDHDGRAFHPMDPFLQGREHSFAASSLPGTILRRSDASKSLDLNDLKSMRAEQIGKAKQAQEAIAVQNVMKDSNSRYTSNTGARASEKRGGFVKNRSHLMNVVKWATVKYQAEEEEVDTSDERVLFCIPPGSSIRIFFLWLGQQKWFDTAVYAAIITSCVFLALIPPAGLSTKDILRLDPDFFVPVSDETTRFCAYLFTFIFTAEFLVKVLDHGLLYTKRAYLKDYWNVLDSVILAISWFDVIVDLFSLDSFKGGKIGKVLRLGRAFRPLRLLKRNEAMRTVIDALFGTLYPVAYVILFLLFTMWVFALLGMGLFAGKFFYCSTQNLPDPIVAFPAGKIECMGYLVREDGVLIQRAWENPPFHFDTFRHAMRTLFVVQTYKFLSTMQHAMDLTGHDQSPEQNASVHHALFFIMYLFIGGLFVMNLFVGFIVDGFNVQKGTSDAEIHYSRITRQLEMRKPTYNRFSLPANVLSEFCRNLIGSNTWQTISAACVAVNVLINLTVHTGASEEFEAMIDTQNNFFNYVLFMEVFITLIGYGPGGFVDDRWKMFDAFVCFGSVAGMVINSPSVTKISKAFRLFRILRLMIMIKAIRVILETLIAVLPQLLNILLLLVLVYSIFAVIFVQIFGLVKPGQRLGETGGFRNFPYALLTIYQIVTGDEWHLMMADHDVEWPSCTLTFNEETVPGWTAWKGEQLDVSDCGGPLQSLILWVLLKVFCESIMLNLFIGMILDNFSFIADEATHVEDAQWSNGASTRQMELLAKCFCMFDHRTGMMSISALHSLMCTLPQPLGFRKPNGKLAYGPWERASERLIQAELNVIVRYKRNVLLQKQINSYNPFLNVSSKKQHKVHAIDFVTYMKTLLYWRKPELVPTKIKTARWKVVDEVILTAYALIMVDTLGRAVRAHKKRQTIKTLSGLKEFQEWEVSDEPRGRRKESYQEEIQSEKELARQEKKKEIALYWNPTANLRIALESVGALPEDMVSHHQCVRANKIKVPKPASGLQVFRNLSESHLVVMKFLDPKHQNTGYVMVDFTSVNFNGWEVRNTPADTFLVRSPL